MNKKRMKPKRRIIFMRIKKRMLECRQSMGADIRESTVMNWEEGQDFIQWQWEEWPKLALCLPIPEKYWVRVVPTTLENVEVGGTEQQQQERVTIQEKEKWHREYKYSFSHTGSADDPRVDTRVDPGADLEVDPGEEPGADPGADDLKEAYSKETNDKEE